MREVRFRCRDITNNNWMIISPLDSISNLENLDKSTLSESTGLFDKNNKEIYEGDIITFTRGIGNWSNNFITTTHEVVWDQETCSLRLKTNGGLQKLRYSPSYVYEVIGDVYELVN